MSATAALLQAYQEWRAWTQSETDALERSDWATVAQCHRAKDQLQARILSLTQNARSESESGHGPVAEAQRQIQSTLTELVALESSNAALLTRRVQASRCRAAELHQVSRTLGRVHRSYGALRSASTRTYG